VERSGEIAVLRALGATRGQIGRLLLAESALVACYGALTGVALGLAWAAAGHDILVTYGIDALRVPWNTIGLVVACAMLTCLLAAALPAHQYSAPKGHRHLPP
jgi:putative ABC transport system permease protein